MPAVQDIKRAAFVFCLRIFSILPLIVMVACKNPLGSNSSAQLAFLSAANLTDSDNTTNGFGGGSFLGTAWSSSVDNYGNSNYVKISTSTNNAGLDASWAPAWSNLIGLWHLDEASWSGIAGEVVDSSGTGLNSGMAYFGATTISSGQLKNAGTFVAANTQYIQTPSTTTLNPTTGITVQAWIVGQTQPQGFAGFIEKGAMPGSQGDYFFTYSNAGSVGFGVNGGAHTVSATVTIGVWSYVVGTFDGTTMKIYINGSLANSTAFSGAIAATNSPLTIGSFNSTTFTFNGSVDEVAIWNTPLSPTQIRTIYDRQSAKYAGTFTSRVMNTYVKSPSWSSFSWKTSLPFFKELSDNSSTTPGSETGYSSLSSSLMNNIQGLWHLDEPVGTSASGSVIDRSGHGNNGTPNGGLVFGSSGMFGTAPNFRGAQYVDLGTFAPITGNALTISAWILGGNAGTLNMILAKGSDNSSNSFMLLQYGATFCMEVYGASLLTTCSGSLNLSVWHHIVGIVNGSTMSIYVDGALVNSRSIAVTLTADNQSVWIGGQNRAGTNEYYNGGYIDEVAIWNRALADGTGGTPREIQELYRRGTNRAKYQLRTCADATCSTNPTWLGPDGTNQTYFTELNNNAIAFDASDLSVADSVLSGFPFMNFANFSGLSVPSNEYFQYRVFMESSDIGTSCNYGAGATWCSPEINSVSVTLH